MPAVVKIPLDSTSGYRPRITHSLRSSLFRFLLARESESQGEVARMGREQKEERGGGGGEEKNLPLIFLSPLSPSPRATPACLKGNGKDCYAGYITHWYLIMIILSYCFQVNYLLGLIYITITNKS